MDTIYSVEDPHNSQTCTEMVGFFRGLLVAAGYHPNSADECCSNDIIDPWNSDCPPPDWPDELDELSTNNKSDE